MANLNEIVATPGLDGIYVGPADLTLGTQNGKLKPGFDRQEPVMIDMIKRIASTCRETGIAACLHCGTSEYAAQAIGWGYNLTTVGGDTRLLAGAASASVATWRKLNRSEKDLYRDGVQY